MPSMIISINVDVSPKELLDFKESQTLVLWPLFDNLDIFWGQI